MENSIQSIQSMGAVHDIKVISQLMALVGNNAENFIADKGYNSNEIREKAIENGLNPVIPTRKNCLQPNQTFDTRLYKFQGVKPINQE